MHKRTIRMKTHFSMRRTSVVASAIMLAAGIASAEDTNKWETTAAAGLSLTRGNSETLLAALSVNSKHKTERDEILLGATGTYGENTVEKTVVIGNQTVKKDE